MALTRTRIAIAGGFAAVVGAAGFAAPVLAQGSDAALVDPPAIEAEAPDAEVGEDALLAGEVDCDVVFADEFEFEELSAEDIAEINAETDAIVAFLADNGVTVEVETDEDGIRWPVIADDDDATWDLVDQYFEQTYGDELDSFETDEFDDIDLDEMDLDEMEGDAIEIDAEELTEDELAALEDCFEEFELEDCEDGHIDDEDGDAIDDEDDDVEEDEDDEDEDDDEDDEDEDMDS